MESSAGSVPLPPLFPNYSFPISNNLLRGTGQLTWLSPKAGLISCSKPNPVTVSFQLKDFCDAGVSDLTSVLRVGFRLAFHAASPNDSNEWIANYVAPISDTDLNSGVFNDAKEMDLESIEQNLAPGVRQAHKDPYSIEMEVESLSFLLSIFHKNSVHFIPLSSLHSRISNSGKEDLYRYIGSSSLKRRQFIERRSYIFHIAENDVVFLQPPEIYMTVCILTGFLLSHGGVTSSDALFIFFNTSALVPLALKESIKNNRMNFMTFLSRHPFAFAPFPSQFYVSVRRNLPYFDYSTFIKKNFPACVYPRVSTVPTFAPQRPPIPPFNGFDHMGDGVANVVPPFHTPTTPMTPLFQEDPLIASQKAARAGSVVPNAGWPNEIGYFDHQSTGGVNGPMSMGPGPNSLNAAAVGKVPIMGSQPIMGRSNCASIFGGGNGEMPMPPSSKMDFAKVDVSKRPTELNLLRNSPILFQQQQMQMMSTQPRKILVDRVTQTDLTDDMSSFRNINRVDRAVGADVRCRCKCTCTENQQTTQPLTQREHRQSSTESLSLPRTQSEVNNHADFGGGDFVRQRPVSVQEQPLGFQLQRPLFSAPVVATSAGPLQAPSSAAAASMSLMGGGMEDSTIPSMNNLLFGNMVKSLAAGAGDFENLHDSFFNHTLNSFASSFMPITTTSSLMNGGDFLGSNAAEAFAAAVNLDCANAASAIGQRSSTQQAQKQQQYQGRALPMPIGVSSAADNSSSSINNNNFSGSNAMNNSSHNVVNNGNGNNSSLDAAATMAAAAAVSNSGGTAAMSTAADSSSSSHYDPFGNGLPFKLELPSFSSLKL